MLRGSMHRCRARQRMDTSVRFRPERACAQPQPIESGAGVSSVLTAAEMWDITGVAGEAATAPNASMAAVMAAAPPPTKTIALRTILILSPQISLFRCSSGRLVVVIFSSPEKV